MTDLDLISWRRFCILVQHLPADSAVCRALEVEDNKPVSDPDEITAILDRYLGP
jgi:hypothetical protein